MTNKAGRVNRKKRPDPDVTAEPPLIVRCICPECQAEFDFAAMPGSYLDRRCPFCDTQIYEASYDEKARGLGQSIKDAEFCTQQLKTKMDCWSRLASKRVLTFLPGAASFVRWRVARYEEMLSKARAATLDSWRQLSKLALSRYYTGEWFLRTRNPLQRTVVKPFRLTPQYTIDGVWRLPSGNGELAGMTAEFEVFQELLARVRNRSSVLWRAQLLPNLYLPREPSRAADRALWSQVDLVVATRQAAFIVEVKSRKGKSVRANAPFEEVEIGGAVDSSALAQNSRHAVAFADVCPRYPFEAVYEQLVFARLRSFEVDEERFVENVNVSQVGPEGPSFVDPIEAECTSLPPLLEQQQLEKLGEQLVNTYGDLNQKRAQLHVQRIKNLG